MTIKDFLIARSKEASTWRGLVLLVGGFLGLNIPPENQEAIVAVCLMVAGAIGAIFPDA